MMNRERYKILWICAYSPEDLESAANRLRKLSKGLSREGVNVDWKFPRKSALKAFSIFTLAWQAIVWGRANPEGYVIFTLPPAWLLLSAAFFSIFRKKQMVLDFRDPLVNQKIIPRTKLANKIVDILQNFVIARARKIIIASPAISDFISRKEDICTILSGYDTDEVISKTDVDSSLENVEVLKCLYGGTFYGSRSPLNLVKSISQFKKEVGGNSLPFLLQLNCQFNDALLEREVLDYILVNDLQNEVKILPLISKVDFNVEMNHSDILIVITHSEGSEYAIPGKIFDYIGAQKTVWLISNDKLLLSLMEKAKIPHFQSSNDEASLLVLLRSIIAERINIKNNNKNMSLAVNWSCLSQGTQLRNFLFESTNVEI